MKSLKQYLLEGKKDIYYIIDYNEIKENSILNKLITEIEPYHILTNDDFKEGSSMKEFIEEYFIYDDSNYFADKGNSKPKVGDLIFENPKGEQNYIFYRPGLNEIAGNSEVDDQVFVGTKDEIIKNLLDNKEEFDFDIDKIIK